MKIILLALLFFLAPALIKADEPPAEYTAIFKGSYAKVLTRMEFLQDDKPIFIIFANVENLYFFAWATWSEGWWDIRMNKILEISVPVGDKLMVVWTKKEEF